MNDLDEFLNGPPAPVNPDRGRARPAAETQPEPVKRGRGRPPLPPELKKPVKPRMNPEQLRTFHKVNLDKARKILQRTRPGPSAVVMVGKLAPPGARVVRACQELLGDNQMTLADLRQLASIAVDFESHDPDQVLGPWGVTSGYFTVV